MNKALIELEARRSIICSRIRDSQEEMEISNCKKHIEILDKIIAKVKEETMTNTTLTVDNPFGLYDGCFAKLSNNDVVGPLLWQSDKGRFILPNNSSSWYPNGSCFGTRASIASLTVTPREPVKVPEPWTVWRNVIRGGAYRGDWSDKATAISRLDDHAYTLEIECRVVRVHFPDGTTQEVK